MQGMSANSFIYLVQEAMQSLVDQRAEHPKKVFNNVEKSLLKRADEMGMTPTAPVQTSTRSSFLSHLHNC